MSEEHESDVLGKLLSNFPDIQNPDFARKRGVHDWRNYVPEQWQAHWNSFTSRERRIIIAMADHQSDNEVWD